MRASVKMMSAAAFVPLVLAACAPENDGDGELNGNEPDNGNMNADNEDPESGADAAEVEELADEYGLDVTVTEDAEGEAADVSLEELEEAFATFVIATEAEVLEFLSSPNEGEGEQSGDGTADYAIPGAEADQVNTTVQVSFAYELDGDLDDDSRFPTFADVTDIESEMPDAGILSWEESAADIEIEGAGTIAEFHSEGEWLLHANYDGLDVEASETNEWIAEFSTSTLAGIEE